MLQAIRNTFDATGQKYLLTAAVGAAERSASQSYDIPAFAANLDFINLMAYDFHGAFDGVTGQNAPLYNNDDMNVVSINLCFLVRYFFLIFLIIARMLPSNIGSLKVHPLTNWFLVWVFMAAVLLSATQEASVKTMVLVIKPAQEIQDLSLGKLVS